tara:strand:+ start:5395 stop:6423 length:1029 start_codon:yes stop_codon:yes gene_type:complete
MKKTLLLSFIICVTNIYSQTQEIPYWFTQEWKYLTSGTGIWETDNAEYKNEFEPYDKYRLEWNYGLGNKSIVGSLIGVIDGKKPVTFWEFWTFWDSAKNKGLTLQTSPNGTFGIGEMELKKDGIIQTIQTFTLPNGKTYQVKHESLTTQTEHKTTSFNLNKFKKWVSDRTYIWKPILIKETAESQIDTLQSGELMLKQQIVINTAIDKVWNAFSEPEEWKKWVTPVVEMDFKINGTIKSNYEPTAIIGDKGTIIIHILTYIPHKQIVMQAELNENFPEFIKGEEKNLFSVFDFERTSENQTKVTIYGLGYKNEKKWQELLHFFVEGNELSLNNLKKYLENNN